MVGRHHREDCRFLLEILHYDFLNCIYFDSKTLSFKKFYSLVKNLHVYKLQINDNSKISQKITCPGPLHFSRVTLGGRASSGISVRILLPAAPRRALCSVPELLRARSKKARGEWGPGRFGGQLGNEKSSWNRYQTTSGPLVTCFLSSITFSCREGWGSQTDDLRNREIRLENSLQSDLFPALWIRKAHRWAAHASAPSPWLTPLLQTKKPVQERYQDLAKHSWQRGRDFYFLDPFSQIPWVGDPEAARAIPKSNSANKIW